jgi:ketosteroid isomerase-like protein
MYRADPSALPRSPQMPDQAWWENLFKTIDDKDLPAFMGYLTPDAEFRFANNPSARGHEAVGAVVGGFFGAIGGSRHRFIHAWEDAGTAACEGEVTYTRHDGSTLTVPFVNVFYMRGGKVARYLIVIDNSALFA